MRVLLHQRAVGLDRPPDDVPEIEAQGQERDLAARHPGHVEQVVEDTRRVRDRTVDNVADGLEARLGCTEAAQERDGDGCEGIPQLVRQHCEELILGGARGFDLLVEPRVLRLEMPLPQVGADLARNDRQQPQVLLGVRARRLPHVEQADEVGRDDRKHQVGGVRELSSHLGRGQVRVQRGRFGEVAEEPREHLAHASPCLSLLQDDELLRASGRGF